MVRPRRRRRVMKQQAGRSGKPGASPGTGAHRRPERQPCPAPARSCAALALASVETFRALGRVLLAGLAEAAAGEDLAVALRQAADGLPAADADLAAMAGAFAVLARRGDAERRLALALLRDIGDYMERR